MIVPLLLILALGLTNARSQVYFQVDPWEVNVNTIAINTCCYGNTTGFSPDVSGISPENGTEYFSQSIMMKKLGVNCTNMDENGCRICSVLATPSNDGLIIKCSLTKNQSSRAEFTANVTLVVLPNVPTDVNVSSNSTTESDDEVISPKSKTNTPITIGVSTFMVILVAVFTIVSLVTVVIFVYKRCRRKNAQRSGTEPQPLRDVSLASSESDEAPVCFWKLPLCCDAEPEKDSPEKDSDAILHGDETRANTAEVKFVSMISSTSPRQRLFHSS